MVALEITYYDGVGICLTLLIFKSFCVPLEIVGLFLLEKKFYVPEWGLCVWDPFFHFNSYSVGSSSIMIFDICFKFSLAIFGWFDVEFLWWLLVVGDGMLFWLYLFNN